MENDAYERIAREIEPGERIVWTGRPGQGLRFTTADVVMIPFSILWCGFAIFWTSMAIAMHAPIFMVLWGAMFVMIGLFLVFGRFFTDRTARSRTYYGLTDRRLIAVRDGWNGYVRSKRLESLTDTERKEKPDGTGTLLFDPRLPYGYRDGGYQGARWVDSTRSYGFSFEEIPDVRNVQSLIEAETRKRTGIPQGTPVNR